MDYILAKGGSKGIDSMKSTGAIMEVSLEKKRLKKKETKGIGFNRFLFLFFKLSALPRAY